MVNDMMMRGYFEIWQPRWHDRKVLLATHRVVSCGVNKVKLTRSKSYNGLYEVNGRDVVKCPVESNGTINCYAVPFELLKAVDK